MTFWGASQNRGVRFVGIMAVCGVCLTLASGCQLSHSHTLETRVVQQATCLQSGLQQQYCTSCDYVGTEELINPLEHQYGDGISVLSATCTQDGSMLYTCTRCGESKTETIKAAHTWEETVVKEASCSSAGTIRKTCKACGKTEEITKEKQQHRFNSEDVCTACEAIRLPSFPANQWRVHDEINALQFQNVAVANAFVSGGGRAVTLTYFPICSSCHIAGKQMGMVSPEIEYPVIKDYYCNDCGARTTLQFRIVI